MPRESPAKPRKPKRGFMDGYATYDPKAEGFGSVDDWIRRAESLGPADGVPPEAVRAFAEAMSEGGSLSAHRRAVERGRRGAARPDPDLAALGLDAMPVDAAALKSAFRRALIPAHPDHGGSRHAMEAVTAAWRRLARRLG